MLEADVPYIPSEEVMREMTREFGDGEGEDEGDDEGEALEMSERADNETNQPRRDLGNRLALEQGWMRPRTQEPQGDAVTLWPAARDLHRRVAHAEVNGAREDAIGDNAVEVDSELWEDQQQREGTHP